MSENISIHTNTMRSLVCVVALLLCSVHVYTTHVQAQTTPFLNTPETYAAATRDPSDPCTGITVNYWSDVPLGNQTVSEDFDDAFQPDFGSIYATTEVDNVRKYPNGFRKGQVYEFNDPPFCFKVRDIRDKQVQVMLQTLEPLGRLCIRDTSASANSMGGVVDHCFSDKHTACFVAPSAEATNPDLTLLVYVDSSGATSPTQFWYRVRVSEVTWNLSAEDEANSAVKGLDNWCSMLDQDTDYSRFPTDLRSEALPDGLTPKPLPAAAFPTSQGVSIVAVLTLLTATIINVLVR